MRLYAVGPATAQALRDVSGRVMPSCEVYGGEEAGSGEVLARLILRDRGEGSGGDAEGRKEAVLFLAGEKRRDVIPRMLMDPGLGDGRIRVDEMVVYQTGELEEFEFHFSRMLGQTEAKCGEGVRWVVVFSPTAGKGMLKGLGWLDEGGCKVRKGLGDRRTFVACIGPTTRVYMEKEFGFKADVVAQKPSPQEVRSGIERFMEERGL